MNCRCYGTLKYGKKLDKNVFKILHLKWYHLCLLPDRKLTMYVLCSWLIFFVSDFIYMYIWLCRHTSPNCLKFLMLNFKVYYREQRLQRVSNSTRIKKWLPAKIPRYGKKSRLQTKPKVVKKLPFSTPIFSWIKCERKYANQLCTFIILMLNWCRM